MYHSHIYIFIPSLYFLWNALVRWRDVGSIPKLREAIYIIFPTPSSASPRPARATWSPYGGHHILGRVDHFAWAEPRVRACVPLPGPPFLRIVFIDLTKWAQRPLGSVPCACVARETTPVIPPAASHYKRISGRKVKRSVYLDGATLSTRNTARLPLLLLCTSASSTLNRIIWSLKGLS